MSSFAHLQQDSRSRRADMTAVQTRQIDPSSYYGRLVARDTSSIHAGDSYTTNEISVNRASNISINGPAILIDSDLLQNPGAHSLVRELESITLRKEIAQLRSALSRLENNHVERSPDRVSKRQQRRKGRKCSNTFTSRTSITFGLPPPGDLETVLTMKIRFTISYSEDSLFGFTNHWYEYNILVANPTHRRLVASHSGIGIANLGVDNEYFPSFEVCITLDDGWVWGDTNGFDDHTKAEVFQCRTGSQVIERDMTFRRRPLLLY